MKRSLFPIAPLLVVLLNMPINAALAAGTDIWQGGTNSWASGFSPAWTSGDTAQFNGSGNQTVVVNLNAAQTAAGITVTSAQTGSVLLQGGGTANQTLTLNSGGVTIAPGAGAVTFGSTTANQGVAIKLGASQNWANNSGSLFTVVNNINLQTSALTINGSGTGGTTLSGIISGGPGGSSAALTINTSGGTTTLSGANTYSGVTTLTTGTLVLSGAGTLGSTSNGLKFLGTTNSDNTLDLNGTSQTVTGVNAGNSAAPYSGTILNNSGSGTSTLTVNLITGSTSFLNTLIEDNSNSTSGTVAIVITGTLAGGSQHIQLGGNNTFSGGLTLNGTGGTTILATNTAAGTGSITIGTGNYLAVTTSALTVGNNITGAGSVEYANSATPTSTLTLTGVLSYTGLTSFGTSGNTIKFASTQNNTLSGAIGSTTAGSGYQGTTPVSGGNIIQAGPGTLTLSGTNYYTGTTTITGGTLQFAKEGSLYNDTSGSWTKTNIIVNSGATLAFNVGGSNEFTTTDVTTLLTNLDGAVSNNGLKAGSVLGFDTTNASGGTFTIANAIANTTGTGGGAVGLVKLGTGTLTLTNTNTYTGGTTVSGGKLLVNGGTAGSSTASGVGSGAVAVNSGGTLAGSGNIAAASVAIHSGGTLSSGGVQSGTTVTGTGMSLTNVTATVSSGTLTFTLGAGTTAGSGAYNFATPNTNTTYLKLAGSTTMNFSGSDSIALVDLTGGGLSALRLSTPYLLATAGSNADYLNLVIQTGTGAGAVYSLSQNDALVNGYVLGVATGVGTLGSAGSYTPIAITQYGADGVTPLTGSAIYAAPALYLNAGSLEVVPEPGTWALMLGGVAALLFWQRRKSGA